jgi:hypothetical protein
LFLANGFSAKSFTPMVPSLATRLDGFVEDYLNNTVLTVKRPFLMLSNLAPFMLSLVLMSPLLVLFIS